MKKTRDRAPASPRAQNLKRQSDNCVAIAVRQDDPDSAALLLDEAIKLATRARELADPR